MSVVPDELRRRLEIEAESLNLNYRIRYKLSISRRDAEMERVLPERVREFQEIMLRISQEKERMSNAIAEWRNLHTVRESRQEDDGPDDIN
ncbi:hypothetical protein BUALT_Bualt12G0054100 [Buddleja alternifolia]|uniref:Uncharacterized protein n=1 Tax=Buddleja alternifolia TaxID=168488 RepID=A0AAV6WVI9_9LAMI|nr:hypothetical protein BUALT_Bualt12G0054100 [Buddleja alternifolia]